MNLLAHSGVVLGLATAIALSGCGKISAALSPAPERITKAFPLSDETALAVARYVEADKKQEGRQPQAADQVDRLLNVRALTCTASVSISRFDTPQDIQKKPVDADCLRRQDGEIGEWVGMQRLSAQLTKPPLIPLSALGAQRLLPAYEETTVGIVASADSNVALVESTRGEFTAIRLPDGKALQTFKGGDFNRQAMALSPNGRVLMAQLQSSRGLRAFDVESGAQLWSTDKYRQLVTWLPGVNALLAIRTAPDGGTALIDLGTGKTAAYGIAERNPSWAIAMQGGAERQLIGGSGTAMLMDHVRETDGTIAVTPVGQWRLTKQISSNKPWLMGSGTRLVYQSFPGLASLDLASGNQDYWDLAALRAGGFAKISESKIFYSAPEPGSPYKSVGKVMDIEASSVAPVTHFDHNDGLIISLAPRTGYMRRGNSTTSVGAEVQTGEAQDLLQVISAANLEVQLAKLKQAQEQQAQSNSPPMLTNIPANAQVDVLGVYESKVDVHGAGKPRPAGVVHVTLTPSSTPLVLVLSSYEPVRWVLNNPGRRKVSAVLLSGYHESSVFGADDTQVLRIGSNHAYKLDSPDYMTLKKNVARYVGNPVRTFQGAYSAQSFTVTAF